MMDAIEGFYSASEFMRIYGVPRSSFYRLVKQGRLRIHKIGRASRVAKSEAKAWAASLPIFGGPVMCKPTEYAVKSRSAGNAA